MSRIIDKDIECWTAFIEHDVAMLQRVKPEFENYWCDRVFKGRIVLAALQDYKAAMAADHEQVKITLEG